MLVNILLWIILGAVAGWLASLVMGRDAEMGAIANIVVGILGAFVGGLLMNLFGEADTTGFNLYSLIVAFIGSIALLFLYGLVRRSA
jgi:uncharacterized membrane protein YeaQ/YmgE (transglycosylase-associated protein family)